MSNNTNKPTLLYLAADLEQKKEDAAQLRKELVYLIHEGKKIAPPEKTQGDCTFSFAEDDRFGQRCNIVKELHDEIYPSPDGKMLCHAVYKKQTYSCDGNEVDLGRVYKFCYIIPMDTPGLAEKFRSYQEAMNEYMLAWQNYQSAARKQ